MSLRYPIDPLEDAAFQAWLNLGEWLTHKPTHTEVQHVYNALGDALEAHRREKESK